MKRETFNCDFPEAGRAAFVEADGIRILYEGALEASDCRDMESLILLASVILRKCCPRNKLPLESSLSPVLFPLPPSTTHTPDCYYLTNFPGKLLELDVELLMCSDLSYFPHFESELSYLSLFSYPSGCCWYPEDISTV